MKRTPISSAENFVKAVNAVAAGPIEPPAHVSLEGEDLPFWRAVLSSRAREEWTEAHLVVAAQLARSMREYERESELLRDEGSVMKNERGTPVQNPRNAVVSELARREMALMRALRMAGDSVGDQRDEQPRRRAQREAERLHQELEGAGLLA